MIRNIDNDPRVYDIQPQKVDVVRDIIEEQQCRKNKDDAFCAMDMGYFVEMIQKWKRLLPRVDPFYAIKANPDPVLLEMMTKLKLGFDCASMNELTTSIDMGNHPSKMIYANTRKQPSHLQYASSVGISLTTFGDEDELYKIKEYAPDMGLLLRFSTFSFTNTRCQGMTQKFGCYLNETKTLLETAKGLNLCVRGVCFHVGSGCKDPKAFARAIRESKRVFVEAANLGFQMTILDMGGGFPCSTTNRYSLPDPDLSFEKFASSINESLEEYFPKSSGVLVIAEPGACFSMPSTVLATSIIGVRDNRNKTHLADDATSLEYFINDGIHSSMGDYAVFPDLDPVVAPVSKEYNSAARYRCTLWGQTMDFDMITRECQLPKMKTGDWLYSTDAGAYSSVFCTNFNGFEPPRVYRYISKVMKHRFEAMVESCGYDGDDTQKHPLDTVHKE